MGITGLLTASQSLIRKHGKYKQNYHQAMSNIAATGEKTYRDLTDNTEGFLDYFMKTLR